MKTRILDVAYAILSKEGAAALTTRRVCEAVGVTMPTLYYHFKSREVLVRAVYVLAMQKFTSKKKELEVTEDPLFDLRAGCEQVLDFVDVHKNVTSAVMGLGLEEPAIFRPGFELLQERVARASRAKVLHVSAREATAMLWSVVQGLVVAALASPEPSGRSAAVRTRVLDAIFRCL
ncbi:MAG TPA: TetR/AcrR family transcriptional regulator [Polyangiaceae bacterium]|nr:TetR/AcrR family transcriptional regulator [Polyangiaceae bacterium]